ncbi:hypothetical protein CBOM_05599 [Ceraceosorus bombacis]|uniref:Uncharacterized protein n=1 Tax=Ceraceosorus bombacis TaxID=401625 RepID=A0A0N7LBB2_9BASI|nr:hypothetical protein CBOM_05599 [Ceraceosorus bombacis]
MAYARLNNLQSYQHHYFSTPALDNRGSSNAINDFGPPASSTIQRKPIHYSFPRAHDAAGRWPSHLDAQARVYRLAAYRRLLRSRAHCETVFVEFERTLLSVMHDAIDMNLLRNTADLLYKFPAETAQASDAIEGKMEHIALILACVRLCSASHPSNDRIDPRQAQDLLFLAEEAVEVHNASQIKSLAGLQAGMLLLIIYESEKRCRDGQWDRLWEGLIGACVEMRLHDLAGHTMSRDDPQFTHFTSRQEEFAVRICDLDQDALDHARVLQLPASLHYTRATYSLRLIDLAFLNYEWVRALKDTSTPSSSDLQPAARQQLLHRIPPMLQQLHQLYFRPDLSMRLKQENSQDNKAALNAAVILRDRWLLCHQAMSTLGSIYLSERASWDAQGDLTSVAASLVSTALNLVEHNEPEMVRHLQGAPINIGRWHRVLEACYVILQAVRLEGKLSRSSATAPLHRVWCEKVSRALKPLQASHQGAWAAAAITTRILSGESWDAALQSASRQIGYGSQTSLRSLLQLGGRAGCMDTRKLLEQQCDVTAGYIAAAPRLDTDSDAHSQSTTPLPSSVGGSISVSSTHELGSLQHQPFSLAVGSSTRPAPATMALNTTSLAPSSNHANQAPSLFLEPLEWWGSTDPSSSSGGSCSSDYQAYGNHATENWATVPVAGSAVPFNELQRRNASFIPHVSTLELENDFMPFRSS